MKKNFCIVILFFLFGCSALKKDKYGPVNSYLETIIKNENEGILILKEKINNKKALAIFKGNLIYDTKTNNHIKEGYQSFLYNLEDWNKLSTSYTYDTIKKKWDKKNFKNHKIKFTENILFNENKLYLKHKKPHIVYGFSEPMNYMDKQYVVFYVLISDVTFSRLINEFIIIMKKKENMWIVVDKVWSDKLN